MRACPRRRAPSPRPGSLPARTDHRPVPEAQRPAVRRRPRLETSRTAAALRLLRIAAPSAPAPHLPSSTHPYVWPAQICVCCFGSHAPGRDKIPTRLLKCQLGCSVTPTRPVRVGARRQSLDRSGTRHAPRSRTITQLLAQLRADSPAGRERGVQRLRIRRAVWLGGSAGTPRPSDHRRGRTGVASRGPCSRLPEDRPG